MKKKWSLVVAVVVIVVLVVAIVYMMLNRDGENGNELNNQPSTNGNSQAILPESVNVNLNNESGESVKLGNFEVANLKVEYRDGYTFVQGDIENKTEEDYPLGASLEITLYQDGVELIKFPVLTSSLNKGEKSTFESQLTIDCADATDVKIDFVKN